MSINYPLVKDYTFNHEISNEEIAYLEKISKSEFCVQFRVKSVWHVVMIENEKQSDGSIRQRETD